MAKYVIKREVVYDSDDKPFFSWCAYRKIFGCYGVMTYISKSLSVTSSEDCENKLRDYLNKKPDPETREVEI